MEDQEEKKCELCGDPVRGKHAKQFCSRRCANTVISHKRKKKTTEEFIKQAQAVHGDRFSYERTFYSKDRSRIVITCKTHGDFVQRPSSHLGGNGCKKCQIPPSCRPEVVAKRNQTFLHRYGGHPMSSPLCSVNRSCFADKVAATWASKTPEQIAEIMKKKKATFLRKYGYDNPFNDNAVKTAIRKIRVERGEWNDNQQECRKYRSKVADKTNRTYRSFKNHINPFGLQRGHLAYHIDHMYSIQDAYEAGVSGEVVSHPANLRMLWFADNIRKHRKSLISLNELLDRIACFDYQVNNES